MKKKVVLILEDEEGLALALKEKLSFLGAEIFTAYNGADGLALALKTKPDIVLLDVIMPKMHGKEVMKKMRENVRLQKTPVIFLTNLEDDAELEQIASSDKNCLYLTKVDTSLDALIHVVKDKLG